MNDKSFQYDLEIISCETDLTQYINPKTSVLIKILKTAYVKHKTNSINKKMNKVIDDPNLLEKLNNLNDTKNKK